MLIPVECADFVAKMERDAYSVMAMFIATA